MAAYLLKGARVVDPANDVDKVTNVFVDGGKIAAIGSIGPKAGLGVASALLVDYVLTVAVSVSAGVQNAAAAFTFIRGHEALVAVAIIVGLTAMNLRGVRESGTAFAVPTYLFMVTVLGMAAVGFWRQATGTLPLAESARAFQTTGPVVGVPAT